MSGDRGWSARARERTTRWWRDLEVWLASWRGTIRDGAAWRRIRLYWPPPWRHVLIALGVSLVTWWLVWTTCGLRGCPNVERLAAFQPGGASVLLDRGGNEITRLAPFSRELVPLEDLPEHVPAAFLAVEDRRFYEHGAVDWRRFAGSLLANVKAGGIEEGASTITMQLARTVFPDRLPGHERTPRRKLLEVRVAGQIERRFEKDEILELYLNHIYFGGSVYGIDAAAREYFGVPPSELTIAQAATLAAMPKSPNSYNPREDPERARQRRDLVLSLMEEQGRITADEAERARERRVRTARERAVEDRPPPAPYFVRAVRRIVEERLGDAIYTEPLRIHTTLDMAAQAAAERALTRQLASIERGAYGRYRGDATIHTADAVDDSGTRYLQGAAVILSADSGDVLALVGGRDYADSPFDRAIQSRRPVGSAFKPFVYAAALQDGYAPSQHLTDEPLEMELPGGEVWKPNNFTGTYRGDVTLRQAVVESNNVATVRLAMAVGMDEVIETARESGVRSRLHQLPSLALGTVGLSLMELTAAYTPFATLGHAVRPRLVTLVEDTAGDVIWRNDVDRDEVMDPAIAYLVTDLLRDAIDRGTGQGVREVGFRGPAAGKTGTTDDGHDVWFVGYTPHRVGGVWIGFDRPQPVVTRASGGRLAAPVWGRMMRAAVPAGERRDWDRPDDIVEREVDPASGLILAEGCRPETGRARTEVFRESDLPAETCPAGERERRGFFARLGRGIKNVAGRVGAFFAGLFDGDDEGEGEVDRERYLGRPRLPRASETSEAVVEPDTSRLEPPEEPLGVPVEDLPPGYGEVPVEIEVDPDGDPPALEPGDSVIILRPPGDGGPSTNPPSGSGGGGRSGDEGGGGP